MKDWTLKEPVWKRSELQAPFCPDCKDELDFLTMVNDADTCKCGSWSISFKGKYQFSPEEGVQDA